jgi:UDP-N-acetylmuramoyl-L-alanyl-D-glutamate--2,6-diaminopimelate ligase
VRGDRLIRGIDVAEVAGDLSAVEVESVAFDSRQISPGALFCCLTGASFDGHDFAADAVAGGATAILCERILPLDVAQVRVASGSARAAMARASANLYGHPADSLRMVGVTGTDGKTTVAHLVKAILDYGGMPTAVIGTLGGVRTTPESNVLQETLAKERAAGKVAVAMEVSSHALAQGRVDGILFSVAVFTNLSLDHLDYHGSMESYFAAKAALFGADRSRVGVVNADDPWGRRLLEEAETCVKPFSLAEVAELEVRPWGSSFRWEGASVELSLRGRFNVVNALAAAAAARELGLPSARIAEGLSSARPVPGRMEPIEAGQDFSVLVDYAHTPAALEAALRASREMIEAWGRVIVVFGCGGGRDRSKRPAMGEVATRLADLAVLTSDNPRDEDPSGIIDEVRAGVSRTETLVVEPDRASAIRLAVGAARQGDVVLVAGKGHETGQEAAGRTVAFDDRVAATEAVGDHRGATS